MEGVIKLSHITSYLTCPRLAYYRLKFGEDSFTEKHAVKEIYRCLRMSLGIDWAKEKAKALNKFFCEETFNRALANFKLAKELDKFKPIDWDVVYNSEKLGVSLTVDEIVEFCNETLPLFVALNAPKSGVWFQDAVKAGVVAVVAKFEKSIIYYSYSGEIRVVETDFGMKRKSLKLIERLRMIEKGFLPERKESEYCRFCRFFEDCKRTPETFASKFL
ncbi:MAG: hypothetical protein QXQ49_06680 [Archaeoglobaceae archaeon]